MLRWLDRSLIKLAARFGGYTKNQADTFQLPDNFSMMPQWVFNLRRSPFMQAGPHHTVLHLVCCSSSVPLATSLQLQIASRAKQWRAHSPSKERDARCPRT